jgi:hypothetical protein
LATSPTTAGEWGGTTSVWSFSGPERRPNAAKILSGRGLVYLRVGAPPILVLGEVLSLTLQQCVVLGLRGGKSGLLRAWAGGRLEQANRRPGGR